MLRFISITTFPSQMNRMRCSLLRSIVTAIAMYSHSGSRAIITNPTMLSSLFSDTTNVRVTGQYVHIRGRYPCQAYIPSSADKTQQESPKVGHNDPQLDSEWSLNRLCRRNHGSHNPTVRAAESTVWPAQKPRPPCSIPAFGPLPLNKQSDYPQGA